MSSPSQTMLIWEYLSRHPNSTAGEISDALSLNRSYCNKFVNQLMHEGFAHRVGGKGNWKSPRRFSVNPELRPNLGYDAKKGSPATKRFKKKARQKLWNNMKIERKFTISSILASIDVPKTTAYSYLAGLRAAAYIEMVFDGKSVKGKQNGTTEHRYLLIRDTGRLAPIVRKDGCWDQNEQVLYSFQTVKSGSAPTAQHSKGGVNHDMV
ncbi:MarR family transcriptional regulator [Enterovibrio norvegicus]|uniref:Uncharacterized protein n=1 Tax=Enterovibrio norvegicus TaxID=188144 RepID=A0A2N7L869_9GAMM|nr:MarR family transcriptional regulator [Enterovibrio norvegicus]PMN90295.1 hypothetical protein BCT23_20305 [Enterovibrio norvegicus]